MATAPSGILTARPTPAVARRTWPRWLALGLAMLAVAGAAVVWDGGGARLLLGAVGLFLAVRGALLVRGARSGSLDDVPDLAGSAGLLGAVVLGVGVAAVAVALVPSGLAGRVLLVAVPVLLLGAALGLLARGGGARRGGLALLVWSLLATGALVATGALQGWDRAADVATVVSALAVAVLAVPVLLAAANLRALAARPEPARPAGCAGCACGAGGCG